MINTIELSFLYPRNKRNAALEKGTHLSNKAIFYQWMTEYEKLLRHLIVGFEAKPALQDELFQEIALNIWRALPSFRQQSSPKTFVARIAHNVLATHVAKSVKTVDTQDDADQEQVADHQAQSSCPYQALDQQQRQQRLVSAIQTLPLEHQQVVTLALEGMSYKEIAETLDISSNLVGVRLQRAKVALNERLEKMS